MKKFIKKVIQFTVVSFVAVSIIIYCFMKIWPEFFLGVGRLDYNIINYQYNNIKGVSKYRNIIIGDSKGTASISPEILGKSWINLSIPGSDFFEGYYTLKYYLSKNKVDTVLMYYCPEYIEGNSPFFNARTIPCHFISFAELKALEKVENKYGQLIHSLNISGINRMLPKQVNLYLMQKQRELSYIHFPLCYNQTFRSSLNDLIFSTKEGLDKEQLRFNKLKNNLGQMNYGDSNFNNLNHYPTTAVSFNPNLVVLSYLDSIIKIADKYKVVIYLAPAPINQTTFKAYQHSEFEKTTSNFYKITSIKYPSLHLLNEPAYLSDSLFGDHVLHPNKKGTIAISNQIKEAFKSQ